jgi:hypothetical protein
VNIAAVEANPTGRSINAQKSDAVWVHIKIPTRGTCIFFLFLLPNFRLDSFDFFVVVYNAALAAKLM